MIAAAVTGLLLGIANAAHCAGMCGVLAIQAAALRSGPPGRLVTAFGTGKAFTYVFLGALAGWSGERATDALPAASAALGSLAALAMFAAATALAFGKSSSAWGRRFVSATAPILAGARRAGPFAFGLATGFIPCGVTAIALMNATSAGNACNGIVIMVCLGAGTLPVLLAVAIVGRGMAAPMRRRWRIVGAVALVGTGALTLYRTLTPILSSTEGTAAACCH